MKIKKNKSNISVKDISKEMRLKNFVAEGESEGQEFSVSTCISTGNTVINIKGKATYSFSVQDMIKHALDISKL